MNKFFRLKHSRLWFNFVQVERCRYDFNQHINIADMSTKRNSSETLRSGTSKKIHLLNRKTTILTTREFSELKRTTDMNLIVKTGAEVMETPDKSEFDKKSYRTIRLENGLTALLISDPVDGAKTVNFSRCGASTSESTSSESSTAATIDDDKESEEESSSDEENDEEPESREKLSACSLSVDVGSFSDPREVQGLAHFLEHMIFMGSEKYPSENEFDHFIKKAGGSDNAATDFEDTSYYFEVREECLDGAMDRFSQFFKAPLMLKEAMQRERQAVESEFAQKMNGEGVRRDQLIASLGQPDHPSSIFSWGNLKTLKENIDDESLYQKVHEFRRRHYSAHRMYLCLQSRFSLDDLQKLVENHFSTVPNNHLDGLDFSKSNYSNAFQSRFYEKVFFVKPVGNVSKIDFTWCLPPQIPIFKTKPYYYMSFLLGHEGRGSLLSYLRKKLWAVDLLAGIDESGIGQNSLFSLFAVSILLTDDGFKHLDEVVDATFSYLRLLKREGPNDRLFREVASIEETTFRFANEREAIDNVEDLVLNLKHYPPKYILTGDSLYFEYDPVAIQAAIERLNSRQFNIMITSIHQYDENVLYDQREQWFGTEYTERDLPEKWIASWNNVQPYVDFSLPEPNPYIADDFTILYDKSQVIPKHPVRIFDNDVCELWFRQDDKFLLPHAHYSFYFISPHVLSSTDNMIMMTLFAALLKYQLVEKLYPATSADLEYKCYSSEKGLVLKVSGYNQKLHIIVDEFTKYLKRLADDVTEDQFRVFVQQQFKTYENIFLKPKAFVNDLRLSVMERHRVPLNEKNQRLKLIQFNDFQVFCRNFTQQMKIKSIMQGNLKQEHALSIIQQVLSNLSCDKIENPSSIELKTSKIPVGSHYLRVAAFNQNDVNTVTTNYYQIGSITFRLNVMLDLLMILSEEPLFDILRNKEQLGYDVSCTLRDNHGILGYSISVSSQENKFTADHVDERVEKFRQDFLTILEGTSEQDFESFKSSLIKIKLSEDNELSDELTRNWTEITTDEYIFDRHNKEVEALTTITKDELVKFYRENCLSNVRKFSTQIIGNPEAANESDKEKNNDLANDNVSERSFDQLNFVDFKQSNSGVLIKGIHEFKNTLDSYAPAKTP